MVNTKTTLSKKVLAIVLAVACMVAFTPAIAFTQSANAASKLKVSPTKATVYVAKTKTIKAKGLSKKHLKKVKWTTSKKSVVSISKTKGSYTKAKGKKAGTAYVTAKYGKKKAKAKITVKAVKTAIKGVTVTNMTTGSTTKVNVGDIMKATTTPSGATVKYQWYAGDTAISGATEQTFKVTAPEIVGKTITCKVTGTGAYSGSVTSTASVAVTATALGATLAITNASGTTVVGASPIVGDVLTADTTPANASVTWQWYRSNTAISGATSAKYTVTSDDFGYALTAIATGTNGYTGTATSATGNVINALSTSATLTMPTTAPTVGTPFKPTLVKAGTTTTFTNADFMWYQDSYSTATGAKNVEAKGTTKNTLNYEPVADDVGHKLVLVVKGTGNYGGTIVTDATAAITQPITAAALSATTDVTVGTELTCNTTPADATATYQWYADGTAISGADASTFAITKAQIGKKITVKVTGLGKYTGTVTSDATVAVTQGTLSGVTIKMPTTAQGTDVFVGDKLTAETTPAGAKDSVTYQWYRGANLIANATGSTYTTTTADLGSKIKVEVKVSDTDAFAAKTVDATTTNKVTKNIVGIASLTMPTAAPSVTTPMTAKVTSTDAATTLAITTDYTAKWYNKYDGVGSTTNVACTGTGNDKLTYTPDAKDLGKTLVLVITGAGDYAGTIASSETAKVSQAVTKPTITATSGTDLKVGTTYKATIGTGETVTYKWLRDGSEISGATAATYTITAADDGHEISCQVTGTGSYTGTKQSAVAAIAGTQAIASVNIYDGDAEATSYAVGKTYTAVTNPIGGADHVTYQWYANAVTFTPGTAADAISGATSKTFTPTADQLGKYIGVKITMTVGDTTYTEVTAPTAVSNSVVTQAVKSVTVKTTDKASATATDAKTTGAIVGSYAHASVDPTAATVTYAWYLDSTAGTQLYKGTSVSGTNNALTDASFQIKDATYYNSASATTAINLSGHKLVCVATGTGSYSGTVKTSTDTVTTEIKSVAISSTTPVIGTALTATTTGTDGSTIDAANLAYKWYSNDTEIANATSSTYTPTVADYGKAISVKVTHVAASTVVTGSATDKLTLGVASIAFTGITITGTTGDKAAVDDTITATVNPAAAKDGITYQWYRLADDSKVPAVDAIPTTATKIGTDASYKITSADKGYTVFCVATPNGTSVTGTAVAAGITGANVIF